MLKHSATFSLKQQHFGRLKNLVERENSPTPFTRIGWRKIWRNLVEQGEAKKGSLLQRCYQMVPLNAVEWGSWGENIFSPRENCHDTKRLTLAWLRKSTCVQHRASTGECSDHQELHHTTIDLPWIIMAHTHGVLKYHLDPQRLRTIKMARIFWNGTSLTNPERSKSSKLSWTLFMAKTCDFVSGLATSLNRVFQFLKFWCSVLWICLDMSGWDVSYNSYNSPGNTSSLWNAGCCLWDG